MRVDGLRLQIASAVAFPRAWIAESVCATSMTGASLP